MKNNTLYSLDSLNADEVIKYCKACNKCWEQLVIQLTIKSRGIDTDFITYYDDFPTYGKEKKTCHQCNGNANHAQKLKGLIVHKIIKS